MDRNGEGWTGDDIAEQASAPGGTHEDASGEAPPTERSNRGSEADDKPADITDVDEGQGVEHRENEPGKG